MRLAKMLLITTVVVLSSTSSLLAFGRGGFVAGGTAIGPAGGIRTGGVASGVSTGPLGGARAGTVHGGSYTGPGGTTVQHVGGAEVSRGPLGGVNAVSGGATRVTTPNGNTYTRAGGSSVGVGPLGGVHAGSVGGAAIRTPGYGGVAVGARTGVAASPFGGVAVGGVRTGVAGVGVGGAYLGGARYGAVGHTTAYWSPSIVRNSAFVVRSNRYPYFTPTFFQGRPNVWVAPRWVGGYNLWRPPVWGTVATFVGIAAAAPIVYDYGSTVVLQNDTVYYNGDPIASAADYANQAYQIAGTGRQAPPVENEQWQPLGVFGMIQQDEKTAQRVFQLAVNQAGTIRGNYYDAIADNNLPVYGSIDKNTQRVAWSIGDKTDIVFETGLPNLTQESSTVLVHYGKESTQQMILVRLEDPQQQQQQPQQIPPPQQP